MTYQPNFEIDSVNYGGTGSDVPTKLTLTEREVNALMNYMDFAFESKGVDEFIKGMGKEDDEVWDIKSTRSVYEKLRQVSNSYYDVDNITKTEYNKIPHRY